ncbi:hypothetical protein Tco_0767152 [Tanacetum coccineum]
MQSKEGKVDSSKALDASLVVTKSTETESERQDLSSIYGKDTHAEDADINSVNDKQPLAEVQLTVQHDTLANEQQHSVQSEPIYDTHLLEKVDSNTTPDSYNMCLGGGGEIEQNAEKCQVSCPLLDLSFDNMTTEFSNQSLESENIFLKKTVAQLQKDFSRMETHCVNMKLKYQNQALKDGQRGQILNETSNKAKIKKEIEVALISTNEGRDIYQLTLVLRFRVNCALRISGIYTSRLLDAASKKVLNLLKKRLLKVETMPKSAWTEKDQIDNFLKERRIVMECPKDRPVLNLWSYKVVRHKYSNPMIKSEPEGSTQGYPLDSVEVLRNKPNKVVSYEVSVSSEGVEDLKKKCKDKEHPSDIIHSEDENPA